MHAGSRVPSRHIIFDVVGGGLEEMGAGMHPFLLNSKRRFKLAPSAD